MGNQTSENVIQTPKWTVTFGDFEVITTCPYTKEERLKCKFREPLDLDKFTNDLLHLVVNEYGFNCDALSGPNYECSIGWITGPLRQRIEQEYKFFDLKSFIETLPGKEK